MTPIGKKGVLCLLSPLLAACGSSSPTQPPTPASPTPASTPAATPTPRADLKPIIEALFMGSGPFTPTDGNSACPYLGY